MNSQALKLYLAPDSHREIARLAKGLLVRGGCLGVLPTPVEQLYVLRDIEEVKVETSDLASLLAGFTQKARDAVKGVLNKVRGAADLRRRVIFMLQNDTQPRLLFARAHELGHQILPWHRVDPDFLDDDRTLSSSVSSLFETEANDFAAELIYQGERFQPLAREYRPSFAGIFELARMHGSSCHATFLQFVRAHDEALAGLVYYPSAPRGHVTTATPPDYRLQKRVLSDAFSARYAGVTFDARLEQSHPWLAARSAQKPIQGEHVVSVEDKAETLFWEAFFNRHCLMVLLRRKPTLRLVGTVLNRIQLPRARFSFT